MTDPHAPTPALSEQQLAEIDVRWGPACATCVETPARHCCQWSRREHAAADVLDLLAEVRRLRAALVDLRGAMTTSTHPANAGTNWCRGPSRWIALVDQALLAQREEET